MNNIVCGFLLLIHPNRPIQCGFSQDGGGDFARKRRVEFVITAYDYPLLCRFLCLFLSPRVCFAEAPECKDRFSDRADLLPNIPNGSRDSSLGLCDVPRGLGDRSDGFPDLSGDFPDRPGISLDLSDGSPDRSGISPDVSDGSPDMSITSPDRPQNGPEWNVGDKILP